ESVQVLKRFASITDLSQVILVIIVDEGPVTIERTDDGARTTKVVRGRRTNLMFLPVLGAEDGYGLTYGARFAIPRVAGNESRIGFPLTWGGEKRASAELEKTLGTGPIDRVTAGAGIMERTNPFYDEDDTRRRVWARAEREVVRWTRIGASAGYQRVTFPAVVGGPRESTTFGHAG